MVSSLPFIALEVVLSWIQENEYHDVSRYSNFASRYITIYYIDPHVQTMVSMYSSC